MKPQKKPISPQKTAAGKELSVRNKYLRSRIVILILILVLYGILLVDSKTGFIKSWVGDKTIEIPVPKWLKNIIG
ncbi:hypothetical protein [Pedobacter nutrimenti]|jgi:hypothetical protein|uniref:Uncharacterized protein n=1 Tax=Pedobacter nutrimenti TaxID=1241337 RepID=A0A318UFM2_9SPHI|nr:hypothetical protein [Pedobacter nutrimenti]PYF74971.1 hypothetical protein B0O44_103417 [Pedobacter nutrimenti]